MKLSDYSKTRSPIERCITFLIKDGKVLLGQRIGEDIGDNLYVGIGGKQEEGETLKATAARELEEEINVEVKSLEYRGYMDFYFVDKEKWNQRVHIFVSSEWIGTPTESKELKPEWFDFDNLPFDKMWEDAQINIPLILKGYSIESEVLYEGNKVIDFVIRKH